MTKETQTLGQKMAGQFTKTIGSWKFIVIQTIILIVWIIVNIIAWINHWDPYPFILLNLALSFQAAYAAPIIMMSQNRTAERDRYKAELDFQTNKRAAEEIDEIQTYLKHIEKAHLNEILNILREMKDRDKK